MLAPALLGRGRGGLDEVDRDAGAAQADHGTTAIRQSLREYVPSLIAAPSRVVDQRLQHADFDDAAEAGSDEL
jgi:hypothetical protein